MVFNLDINLDLVAAVEREIDRQIALNGGGPTYDTAIARLALVFGQQTPKDASNYIERHHDSLSDHINKKYMHFVRIELLARAGRLHEARDRLETLDSKDLSEPDMRHLRRIIDEAGGADPIERRKVRFRETDSIRDLSILVDQLEAQHEWEANFANMDKSYSSEPMRCLMPTRLAVALHNTSKNVRLLEFLKIE